ncbi:2,5-didehydrogluconate reductase [Lentilactobacillus senioris DSM 24302 = JCM 17472]|uniref:2,5-didehydrogluconate reductase n=1 Tax=Lentilactobacillus senioris DSM 24302 = JCM 17472 TaxID=1423802 RepID=A0A0R2CRD0_9LACO|nr:aldo/keto reductase [Lentilactobacillus senioris]KRM94232.1 2,5-didehydrogluconate reductase [Lentilactobacillus senioris DSM 24302 = JCM 17472]
MNMVNFKGQAVLPIGLGTWHMGDEPQHRATEIAALRSGIQTGTELGTLAIDTAEMYGEGRSETLVGEAIQPVERQKLYLISKVYPWNASEDLLPKSLDASLNRLGVDYLDLYLLHWTGNIPLAETVLAMQRAQKAGKIRHWGVSNFDTSDMQELWQVPDGDQCVTNEVLYNLGSRGIEYDLVPWLQAHQLPVIAYSPVAQGDSLGNDLTADPLLNEIAAAHHVSVFQLLLAWVIRNGETLAIPQSSSADHVQNNLAAAKLELTADEWQLIQAKYPTPTRKQPLDVL